MYITQCPNCQTRFKVQPGQLDVCDGQVRCGRCATVFDARASLEPVNEPAPAKPAAPAATRHAKVPEIGADGTGLDESAGMCQRGKIMLA
mgnify:CR=1 FL=1